MMAKDKLDYDCRGTCHDARVHTQAYKVLRKSPKWQSNDGPVMSMNGSGSCRDRTGFSGSAASAGSAAVGGGAGSTDGLGAENDAADVDTPLLTQSA
jgi:hypothetical protein